MGAPGPRRKFLRVTCVVLAIAATVVMWRVWPKLRAVTTGEVRRPTLEQVARAAHLQLPARARLVGSYRMVHWQGDELYAAVDLPSTQSAMFLSSLAEWRETEGGSVATATPATPATPQPWWQPGSARALGEFVGDVEAGGVAFVPVEDRPSGGARVFVYASW